MLKKLVQVLTLFTVQTESISIKKRENLEAPVLNIFMTGDWGGPRESISDDGSKPAQDKYGLSISYSMNQLAEGYDLQCWCVAL